MDWEDLYNRLDIWGEDEEDKVPLPTQKDIEAFESSTGFQLPDSYKGFILQFGTGYLCNLMMLKSVNVPNGVSSTDILRASKNYHDHYEHEEGSQTVTLKAKRSWYFGHTTWGDDLAWDPESVTSQSPLEYDVWLLPRFGDDFERVADSFDSLIVGLGVTGEKPTISLGDTDGPIPNEFSKAMCLE